MADTFTTSLSIRQIETGTRSGTWGSETNTQYELLDNAFSYVNHDLSSDADATLTISDGTASDARYFYIKFTSSVSLTATRTITLAPDDSKKIWIVENATTGSQSLTFKQGSSGGTVTVVNGNTAMIYADGAGATNGAITNAFTDLQLAGTTSMSVATISGDLTVDTSTLKVDSTNNRVGIGTTSPNADLHIGSANATGDATNPALQIGGATTYRLGMYTSTEGAVIANANGDDGIQFVVKTAGEAMRVDGGTGNVGIGTTSPAARLEARENVNGEANFIFSNLDTTSGSSAHKVSLDLNFNRTGSGFNLAAANIVAGKEREWVGAAANQDGYLAFYTTLNETPGEKVRITSAGSVGIGETSPANKLHVKVDDVGLAPIDTAVLVLEKSGTNYINFMGSSTSTQGLRFGDSSDTGAGYLVYNHTDNSLQIGTNGPEKARIDANGRVFIGSTSAVGTEDFAFTAPAGQDATLQIMSPDNTPGREIQLRLTNNNATYYGYGAAFRSVQGGGVNSYTLYVETNATGGVYLAGGDTSWSSVSDERYKNIIEDIENASEKVSTLRTVIGTFKEDPEAKRKPFLIAQDVQAVLPEAVDDTADPNKLGLSYTGVIPLLAAAIKEQKVLIEQLQARLEILENA